MKPIELIDKLTEQHHLSAAEYQQLIETRTEALAHLLAQRATAVRRAVYGNAVFLRGLIEISNHCQNNCLYCGIRRDNRRCARYRLTPEEILQCCQEGYQLGYRTFVLQGGEDGFFTDGILCALIETIKRRYPDCAVTLSLGERSRESYETLYRAGADRYLLRQETADGRHYRKLHPPGMCLSTRLRALRDLKEIGYQVGCGFMVGTPHQTSETLVKDLQLIEWLQPDMCGIGPFIPHHETPFRGEKQGSVALTCYLLSIIRLMKPNILLPATTAMGTLDPNGREKAILAGGNVVMPNLSPVAVRKKYELYDNKICTGDESAQCRYCMGNRMSLIGYEVVTDRGDIRHSVVSKV